ncbi:MAG: PIN domain-containing protein [Candidatus Diapherotrites archaeon]|nr:PIN domain-containing protein [Candidatus Diapherotrites archaeon]
MTDKGLIDSNILVYAFDSSEKNKQEKAKKFLTEIMINKKGILSIQNLAEFHATVTKKINKPISKEESQQIIKELSDSFEILKYSEKTIINSINFENLYKTHFWDSLLASTMQENNVFLIYTENTKDFKKIPWIKAVNPV